MSHAWKRARSNVFKRLQLKLTCIKTTDGRWGVFAPNPVLTKPPLVFGAGRTMQEAWLDAEERTK
jgi:hypothetical protein